MPDKSISYELVRALYDAIGGDSGAVKQLAADGGSLKSMAAAPRPVLQSLTIVPTFQAFAPHPLPCWQNNGICTPRNAAWHIDNTAAYTIKAGTAFATGATLKANASYSVVIMQCDGTINENTLSVNSTGKSLSFTAEQLIKAGSFTILICEESLD